MTNLYIWEVKLIQNARSVERSIEECKIILNYIKLCHERYGIGRPQGNAEQKSTAHI